jgi:hypothetical protein
MSDVAIHGAWVFSNLAQPGRILALSAPMVGIFLAEEIGLVGQLGNGGLEFRVSRAGDLAEWMVFPARTEW